jgi:hypothetical protein
MEIFSGFIAVMIVVLVLMCQSGQFKSGPHMEWNKLKKEHREVFCRQHKEDYVTPEELKQACDDDYKSIRDYFHLRYRL